MTPVPSIYKEVHDLPDLILTSNYFIFSDEDLAENENSQEKSNEDIEENNTFFISTQPSNEPEKIREPSDSENDEKDDDTDSEDDEPKDQEENVLNKESKKRKKKELDKAGRKYPKYHQETEQ